MNKILILQLLNNKFFIFELINDEDEYAMINKLIKESDWFKTYSFVYIIIDMLSTFDVNLWTLKYMSQYGIENVRGGIYNTLYLSDDVVKEIQILINKYTTVCQCGKRNFKIGYYYKNGYLIRDSDNDGSEYELFFKFQCNICDRYISFY